jgi:hypothetical protein
VDIVKSAGNCLAGSIDLPQKPNHFLLIADDDYFYTRACHFLRVMLPEIVINAIRQLFSILDLNIKDSALKYYKCIRIWLFLGLFVEIYWTMLYNNRTFYL